MTDQELKDLVANLAISQKEDRETLREFNVSLRELRESFIEDRKSITELKEAIIEDRKSIIEDRKSIIEDRYLQRESGQKLEKQSLLLFEKIKKLQRSMRDLRKLGLSVGFETEAFFYESFSQYPSLGNYKFDIVSHHVKGQKSEFDIVLYNSKQIGIVEVKNRLRRNRLKEFVNKIPLFRKEFPQYKNFKIIAAVASYSFEQESDQLAKNMGLFVFSRYGQKLRPIHDDSFVAKQF
jgi:hypothetical protein